MRQRAHLILILSLGLSAGCSGTSPAGDMSGHDLRGGGGDMETVSPAQACMAFAAAFCSKLQTCDPNQLTLTYGDMTQCVTREQIHCPQRLSVAGTPNALLACARAYPEAACGDIFQNNPPMACRPGAGTLVGNAVCGLSGQCQTSYCPIDPTTGCGKCITRQQLGGTCSANADCEYGLVCPILPGMTTGKCATTLGEGVACSVDIRCKWGLYCVAGKCAMPLVLGQPCASAGGPGCDTHQGQFCNSGKQCAAYTYAGVNQTCTTTGDTPCSAGGVCKVPMGGTTGTCVAPVADGGVCSTDPTLYEQCMRPAGCEAGTCQVPDPTLCH